ncbi:exonuclease II Exo2 [Schizosaccharomyces octosporus yFS286]|uniref:5'-3' exoribonuclease 1 n=1 Tax=Schizosaccharomyces octosporus (strain yFS286) TaxID=483514 RepID=S9PTI2_SCHOY|nr:exonuclease II Exo2 [Schizosaccharomyces octosporus yFS286]EPX71292.1 exonuclease II Exo2 [Schizosaccharomyces octosporus yFS286]
MGIPKFFRWMSERYPLCSQLIENDRIPEFDNMYLDMNGILHNCTHKNDDHSSPPLPEEEMYIAIFNYIEHLFEKIKPKKLLYMAVDGCAPRAKMNQQRSRRFRTAKDAHDARLKAEKNGEEIPETRFDSNCITPGTTFMERVSRQLYYFIHKKITNDSNWSNIQVILSGHDTPGEGEHKIMEYIRTQKAQPDYDPNTRHCLYGLDADLIMLGLLSHDPHFCLLREEVTFGPASKRRSTELANQKFYLLHLSLLREYLEYEFQECRSSFTFKYDLERILDDFILLAFFVGNDFLPHLPGLHINEGALALMFNIYKKVMPSAGGYINEHGVINMNRLELILLELENFEKEVFRAEVYESKKQPANEKQSFDFQKYLKTFTDDIKALTVSQKEFYVTIRKFLSSRDLYLDFPSNLSSADQRFIRHLASDLHLSCAKLTRVDGVEHLRVAFKDLSFEGDDEVEQEEVEKILEKYDQLPLLDEDQLKQEAGFEDSFIQWKDAYYRDKVHFSYFDEDALRDMTQRYVEGLQWVLFYYYRGCQSWGWYYNYHYSPKISDVFKGLRSNIKFEMGTPFRPFEQLMAVLPSRSSELVPPAFRELMFNSESPIKDFYPNDFALDQNGKTASWEAVVIIPFIDERRLLDALHSRDNLLTDNERERNMFKPPTIFTLAENSQPSMFPSSLPYIFPDLITRCVERPYQLPSMEGKQYLVGLCPGVYLGAFGMVGFPSFHTLKHTAELSLHGINVFGNESKNPSVIVHVQDQRQMLTNEQLASQYIGRRIFVDWPYLREALVESATDENVVYQKINGELKQRELNEYEKKSFERKVSSKNREYNKRFGVLFGDMRLMLQVRPIKGLQYTQEGALVKAFNENVLDDYPIQLVVDKIAIDDPRFIEKEAPPLDVEYPSGTKAFHLGEYNYGRPAQVIGCKNNRLAIWLSTAPGLDATWGRSLVEDSKFKQRYYPSYVVAKMLNLHPLLLSKITSSYLITVGNKRENIGLNLKFDARNQKVLGYSRKSGTGWEFSDKAVTLIKEYMDTFPQLFHTLTTHATKDNVNANDLFPKEEGGKLTAVKAWMKEKEINSLYRVALDEDALDTESIQMIEEKASSVDSTYQVPRKVFGVPRYALLKPCQTKGLLHSQTFSLGDRVVYVQDSGKVPIAAYGTVVSIASHQLDVVFDLPFMSGTTLDGKCSPYRGMQVEPSMILNVTDPQFVVTTRAGSARKNKLMSDATPPRPKTTTSARLVTEQNSVYSTPPPPSTSAWAKNSESRSSNAQLLHSTPSLPSGSSKPTFKPNKKSSQPNYHRHSNGHSPNQRGRGGKRGGRSHRPDSGTHDVTKKLNEVQIQN